MDLTDFSDFRSGVCSEIRMREKGWKEADELFFHVPELRSFDLAVVDTHILYVLYSVHVLRTFIHPAGGRQ